MRILMELGLLGVLLSTKERPDKDNNPMLWRILNNLGYGAGYIDEMSDDEIRRRAQNIIEGLSNDFAYYDASELKVNEVLDRYLVKLHADWYNTFKEDSRQIAITVCALGNKVMEQEATSGVDLWIEEGNNVLATLSELFEEGKETDALQYKLNHFAYVEKILEIVDVFVTTHRGMVAGVEEFAPNDYQDIYPVDIPELVAGVEHGADCPGNDTCECGCKLDHPLLVLEGMEDFLEGRETPASRYVVGVFYANDIKLASYQGNEEGAIDAIKEMGVKAYEWVAAALKSFFDLLTPEKAEEESKEAETAGENNKKALQAMTDKAARIKDAAKAGILALAKQADPSGAMSKVVASLNTAGDGSRVIDGLTSVLNKAVGKSGKLADKLAAAQATLAELKQANDKAGSSDPKNKEVVSNARTNVKDKIAKAKLSVKEVRAAVGEQNKVVKAIQKAIKGISPKIFMEKDAAKPAPAPTEPPAPAPTKGKKTK